MALLKANPVASVSRARSSHSYGNSRRAQAITRAALSSERGAREPPNRRLVLASLPALVGGVTIAEKANALDTDFQDDPEMLKRAKEQRSQRVEEELARQKEFTRREGYKKRSKSKEASAVQSAINQLSRGGNAIEQQDVNSLSQIFSADSEWVNDLKAVSSSLSTSNAAKANAEAISAGLDSLERSAKANDLAAVKSNFVSTVKALTEWCNQTGMVDSISGL